MLLNALQSRLAFRDALERGYAILAVNADSPAAAVDCLDAARECGSPIIVETSLWQLTGRSFGAGDAVRGLASYIALLSVLANSEQYREVPVIYHTDHIKGPQTLKVLTAAIAGVPVRLGASELRVHASTVSLDSSEMTEQQNIDTACELATVARSARVPLTLEIEAGVDDGVTPLSVCEHVVGAVERQHPGNVFLWAPGVGTKHGFSEGGYPGFSPDACRAHRELASRITGRPIGIALHGSSGLSDEALRAAVAAGVVKVNWSSESLLIRSAAAAEYYDTRRGQLAKSHKEFKATAMDNGVQTFVASRYVPKVAQRIQLLNGSGKAPGLIAKIAREAA